VLATISTSSLVIHITQGMPSSLSLSFFCFGLKVEAKRKSKKKREKKTK
jgi:hypothetical protein